MNNKGFTLVELIATILVLALLMSIGAFTIISTMNSVKQKNIDSLVTQIKSAAENYVMECAYSKDGIAEMVGMTNVAIFCTSGPNGTLPLSALVEAGYLTGNAKKADNTYTLVNPNNTDVNIGACTIKAMYNTNGKFVFCGTSTDDKCTAIFKDSGSC